MTQYNTVEFYESGASLPEDLLAKLISLTRDNMKDRYDISGADWMWNDVKKEKELKNPQMRFLVVFAHFFRVKEKRLDALKIPIAFGAFAVYKESGSSLDHTYLLELQTKADYRSLGIGRRLLGLVELKGREKGSKMTLLTVLKNNYRAIAFYKSMGYELDESSPDLCFETNRMKYAIYSKIHDKTVLQHPCFNHFISFDFLRRNEKFDFVRANEIPGNEGLTSIPCSRSFRFLDSLKRHICVDHGVRHDFYCKIKSCAKGLISQNDLEQHMLFEHNIKPLKKSKLQAITLHSTIVPIVHTENDKHMVIQSQKVTPITKKNVCSRARTRQPSGRKSRRPAESATTAKKRKRKKITVENVVASVLENIIVKVVGKKPAVRRSKGSQDFKLALDLQIALNYQNRSKRKTKRPINYGPEVFEKEPRVRKRTGKRGRPRLRD